MAIPRPRALQQVAPILDDGADGQPLSGNASGLNVHLTASNVVIGQVKITNGTLEVGVLDLATRDALAVAIVDGSGDQITSFGGGTQYTEGDTDASITGTAMMMEGAANALVAAPGTAADGLLVNLGTNNDVVISDGGNAITVDWAGTAPPIGAGVEATALRVTVATDSTGVLTVDGTVTAELSATDNAVLDDIAAKLGTIDTDTGAIAVDAAAIEVLLTTIDADTGQIAEGLTTLFDSDGDNTAQQMKASAGRLYFLEVQNKTAADAWLQLFDLATGDVTVGTTAPKQSYLIPPGDGTLYGSFGVAFTRPMAFATAISYACTTTPTGSGDPATGLVVNAGYV